MTNSNSDSIVELTLHLRQQYQSLEQIVDSINRDSLDSIDSISDQIKEIKQTESLLKPLRDDFKRTGQPLPPQLQKPTDETIELIKGLMPKLAQLEKATLDSASRLFPRIQQSVRAVQMQDAYRTHRAS